MSKKLLVLILAALIAVTSIGTVTFNAAENYSENFSYTDQVVAKTEIEKFWNVTGFTALGTADGNKIVNGAYFMRFTDGLSLAWKNKLTSFDFSAEIKGGDNSGHANPQALFLRATNTVHQGMTVFEQVDAVGTTSYAGVVVKTHGPDMLIYVKKYNAAETYQSASTGNKATYSGFEFIQVTIPGGKNTANDFIKVRATDDGNLMSIYIEDVLCATVEMSEVKSVTLNDSDTGKYYTKAVLTNKISNETKTVTDARISYDDATIAFGVRGGAGLYVDNITLKESFNVPAVQPGYAIRFNSQNTISKLNPAYVNCTVELKDGYTRFTSTAHDPNAEYIFGEGDVLDCDTYKFMKIKYRTTCKHSGAIGEFYFQTAASGYALPTREIYSFNSDGEWHTAVLNFSDNTPWTGNLQKLRIDFIEGSSLPADQIMDIEYFAFFKTQGEADAFDGNFTPETNPQTSDCSTVFVSVVFIALVAVVLFKKKLVY